MTRNFGFIEPPPPSATLATWEQYLAFLKTFPAGPFRNAAMDEAKFVIGRKKAPAKGSKNAKA